MNSTSLAFLLFVDKKIPPQLKIESGSEEIVFPEEPMEEGHWEWWDKCFSENPGLLPKYHYGFVFQSYNLKSDAVQSETERINQEKNREYAENCRIFIISLIEKYKVSPLYIELYADYVLSDEDVGNAEEMDLAHTVFKGKDSPEELKFEMNRFYRFTCK